MPKSSDDLLQPWSDRAREILRTALFVPGSRGRIDAADVNAIAAAERIGIDEVMLRMLPIARHFSHAPISNFHVGAVALGASGALYPGANLEFAGVPLNQTVHAEQSTIANASANGERGISALAVTAAPCGHCRQFLNELAGGGAIRIIVEGQPPRSLADLLPASFGPRDLGIDTGMLAAPPVELRFADPKNDALIKQALDAASRSWAPYTKALAGCALRTSSGRTFTGSYLENAAFNPALPPLQSALVSAVSAGEDPASIERAVLVEVDNAVISHRAATEAVIETSCPRARLEVLRALLGPK